MSKTKTITMKWKDKEVFSREVKTSTILTTLFVVDVVAGTLIINSMK